MHPLSVALVCLLLPPSLSQSLPSYSGQYGVGLVDIEVPVENPRNITNTTFTSNGQPAWFLETVFFSLYYPVAPGTNSSAPAHPWIGDPVDCVAAGIVVSANSSDVTDELVSEALSSVAGSVKIPAQADTPLVNGTSALPVLLFSVGDISLRTWYSQYAGRLAANGVVTAVIEHRDGSLACTVVEENDKPNRTVQYYQASQLGAPVSGNTTEMIMEQRSFRQAEVEETVRVLQELTAGRGQQIHQNNSRNEGQYLTSFTNRLDFANLVMGGHSFGATLALQALSDSSISARAGLAFDPGKSSGPLNSNFSQSVLIPDSESWSSQPSEFYGQQHFEVVKEIAESALNRTGASWFMTLLGTAHTSITDAPLLVSPSLLGFFDPTSVNVSLGDPSTNIQQYVTVSTEFFEFLHNGTRSGILTSGVTAPEFVAINLNDSNAQGFFDGWEIHVAPSNGTKASAPTPTPTSTPKSKSAAPLTSCSLVSFLVVMLAMLASSL
ncbi:hypothetical protein L207DRAFT_579428 [Hyaloscypha variabilis F]|uniref:Putative phospholipase n=1 Tax=Hyaloscypha variabilis (strain UAMH 11265 / GT02V1 / F) TaxID=1149755 RepID=A0A2J6S154_HYAVF|nr:hypothetical protein L207DRAFT_579428 [Hyaloscypha variabilis F]